MKYLKMKLNKNYFIKSLTMIYFFLLLSITISFTNLDDKVINFAYHNSFNYTWLDNLSQSQYNKKILDLNPKEFENFIKTNYKYSKDYDCKYWSYLIYNYFDTLKDYNPEYIYSIQNKHILVNVFNEDGYKIIDGNIWLEFNVNLIK